jgi:hypothetical protein
VDIQREREENFFTKEKEGCRKPEKFSLSE